MSILIAKYEYTHTHKRVYSYSWMSILIPNLPRTTTRPATTSSPSYYGMIQGKRPLHTAQNPPRWVQGIPRMGLKTPLIAAQNSPDCGSLIPFLWLKIPLVVAQKSPVRIARTAATSSQTSRPRSKPPPPRLGELKPAVGATQNPRWGSRPTPPSNRSIVSSLCGIASINSTFLASGSNPPFHGSDGRASHCLAAPPLLDRAKGRASSPSRTAPPCCA